MTRTGPHKLCANRINRSFFQLVQPFYARLIFTYIHIYVIYIYICICQLMCVWELFIYNGKSWLSDFYTLGQQTHRVTVSYNHASM